jgi:pimeloyl-ACP methyl ester carboxylesterase
LVFLLVFGFAVAAPHASSAEERQMAVAGTDLAYTEEGTGRPILFVHGAISDARVWDAYSGRIAASGRFVAYTQRYFGTRDWPDNGERFSRETHIADLIAFVEGLDAGPVDLVTWSYSGEIGTYAALQRPDLFRSMVHFEPAVEALLTELPGGDAAMNEFLSGIGPAVDALQSKKLDDAALRFIEAVFRMPEGSAANEPEPFPGYWRDNGRTLPKFIAMPPGNPLTCEELGALKVPTLIVVGTKTLVHYAMMAEQLARCSGNALLARMNGATHDGPYRQTDRFTDLILAFHALLSRD